MKLYLPNTSKQSVGGGWTFLRNLKKGLSKMGVQFVDNWEDCDVIMVTGVTVVSPSEIIRAKQAGKGLVLRVDNVPRNSRNRSQTPHERMKELADIADVVVYQSEWAKNYCKPLTGDGPVIYNGVDTELFSPPAEKPQGHKYFYAYHGRGNELKGFWIAHYLYQIYNRQFDDCHFTFAYNFGIEGAMLAENNYDFWNGEKYTALPVIDDELKMAQILKQQTHLIYPAVSDACPNMVLEALATGLEVVGYPSAMHAGTAEIVEKYKNNELDISLDRMISEYYGVLQLSLT